MTHLLTALLGYLWGKNRARKKALKAIRILQEHLEHTAGYAKWLEQKGLRDQVIIIRLIALLRTGMKPEDLEAYLSKVEAYIQSCDDSSDESGPTVH